MVLLHGKGRVEFVTDLKACAVVLWKLRLYIGSSKLQMTYHSFNNGLFRILSIQTLEGVARRVVVRRTTRHDS